MANFIAGALIFGAGVIVGAALKTPSREIRAAAQAVKGK